MNEPQLYRREFLSQLAKASAAALAMDCVPFVQADPTPQVASADCLVLLWMAGGMAHTETFDPKHFEPFRPGIESKRVLSTFPAIDTSVDGIKFSAGLEEMASVMHEGSLIRTFTLPIVDKITHSRHQYHWHTGYLPPLTVAAPHIGSVIARTLGPKNPDIPAFVDIGESLAEAGREASVLRSFLSAGFLGAEYGPFPVPRPEEAAKQLQSATGPAQSSKRLKNFRALLDASPALELASSYQQESMMQSIDQAYRLINSPTAKVFELDRESKHAINTYN